MQPHMQANGEVPVRERLMLRKTFSTCLSVALAALLLSACVAIPPAAADAANRAVAGAAGVATKAAETASGAMDKAAPVAAGAAATATKVTCESLQGVSKALSQMGTLDPTTAVSDVVAFKAKIDPFVSPMRVLALTMGLDPVSQFILAYDAFGLLIRSLPADANLGAASNAISASLAAVIGATAVAEDALDCAP